MIKKFFLCCLVVCAGEAAWAAFTFDTKAQSTESNANPVTFAYTCGTNAKLLVLGIMNETTAARSGGSPTYASVPLVRYGNVQSGANEVSVEMWYLSNPLTGSAANISIPNGGGVLLRGIASSYNSPSRGAGPDIDTRTGTTQANPSLTLKPLQDGDVIVDIFSSGNTTVPSGNNQTVLYSQDEGSMSSNAQYALQATKAAITFSWTVASDDTAFIVAAFRESWGSKITGDSEVKGDSNIHGK